MSHASEEAGVPSFIMQPQTESTQLTGSTMQNTTTQIDKGSTVNEIAAQYPDSITVFNQFGIDSCCGGAVPLAEAAQRDGADVDELLAALQEVIDRR
jgi:regulator of cell morphogenesis and NO signaling